MMIMMPHDPSRRPSPAQAVATTPTAGGGKNKILANISSTLKCGIINLKPTISSSAVVDLERVLEQIENDPRPFLQSQSRRLNDEGTVDFYDGDQKGEIKIGRILGSGKFYEWHKIKRLPDYHESTETSNDIGGLHKNYDCDHHQCDNPLQQQQQERIGSMGYAMKQFHRKNFSKSDQSLAEEAVLRLVLEAQYLSRLRHPNIISLKGSPFPLGKRQRQGDNNNNKSPAAALHDFFIITPRMVETLESRLVRWRHYQDASRKAEVESFDSNNHTFQSKLRYARDLASALAYLHQRKLILVNLNPKSIGFLEPSGTLQITDLSCCQEVELEEEGGGQVAVRAENHPHSHHHHHHHSRSQKNEGRDDASSSVTSKGEGEMADLSFGTTMRATTGTTTTTGGSSAGHADDDASVKRKKKNPKKKNTTTNNNNNLLVVEIASNADRVPRYVAPEVLLHQYYTSKADVYSWSLILFELLTLSQPYTTYKTKPQHLQKVCLEGQRPHLSIYTEKLCNKELQSLICRTWHPKLVKRPTMSKVLSIISKNLVQEQEQQQQLLPATPTPYQQQQQAKPKMRVVANPQA